MEDKKLTKYQLKVKKNIENVKKYFTDQEELLILVRRLFYGEDISAEEKQIIKTVFNNKDSINIIKDYIAPEFEASSPIGQLKGDIWAGAESQVFGQNKDTIYQVINSKIQAKEMFRTALNLLENLDGKKVNINFTPAILDELQINLIARNLFIKGVEQGLMNIWGIAGTDPKETEEQMYERLKKNSNK